MVLGVGLLEGGKCSFGTVGSCPPFLSSLCVMEVPVM